MARRNTSAEGEARGDPLQSARGDSAREGGGANISEADRDAMEAREDFWSISEKFIYRHHVTPGEQEYAPKRVITPNSVKVY